jgi:hypothetical protein
MIVMSHGAPLAHITSPLQNTATRLIPPSPHPRACSFVWMQTPERTHEQAGAELRHRLGTVAGPEAALELQLILVRRFPSAACLLVSRLVTHSERACAAPRRCMVRAP